MLKKHLLGVIDATVYIDGLSELTPHRSVAAIPFGGRYRFIDFILSNMVNSGIESVAIFPKYKYRSLMDHLSSGKNWGLDRKRDGLFFFPSPELDKTMSGNGSFEHIAANIDFLKRSTQKYVLVSNVNTIFNMNFSSLLDWHMDSGCDFTEVRHKDGSSLEIYLLKTELLLELIETRNMTGYRSVKDVVMDLTSPYQHCIFQFDGFAEKINTIKDYYSTNMSLLNPEIWKQLFLEDRPILTKVKDEPPTHYLKSASVHNSIIANGVVIEGTVENSIIARGVKVAKGAVVKNSIILQQSQIGENAAVNHVILDKDVRIAQGVSINGTVDEPEILRKGSVIKGVWVNS